MGNCCSTPLSDKRQAVFLVDVSTGELSTVRASTQGTAFTYGSDLNPYNVQGVQLKYKATYRTAQSGASKAGPLIVFPIENAPQGSRPWKHPADTERTVKALFNHLLFHGGEQVLFTSWLDIMAGDKKAASVVGVLTSLGRLFLVKGSKMSDTFHVGDMHTVSLGLPGELHIALSPVHPSKRDAKLPRAYQFSTSPAAAEALAQAIRAVSRVLYANAPPQALRPEVTGRLQELPLPAMSQDGGFHSAYCMWHNLHSNKIYPALRAAGEGQAPHFELVTAAAGGDWSGPTAVVATRAALKRLELDIRDWDRTATEAAAWALRYNNVFKSLRGAGKHAVLLAPVLACNTVMLKFNMEVEGAAGAGPEEMGALGNALARNPLPGFAEINLKGNKLSADAALAWAGGFGNLKGGQLVVANLDGCRMDEAGSAAVLAALEPQAQSLATLVLSGNRLQTRGTTGLNKLLGGDAISLQVLEVEQCQASLDALGTALLSSAERLKSLTSLSVAGNPWSPAVTAAVRAIRNLKTLKAGNTSIQPDALQELLLSLSGRSIAVDLSSNPAVGAPNGLAAVLRAGIGVPSIKARGCSINDEGTAAILNAVGDCPAVKVLDIGCNLQCGAGLEAFNRWLQIEIATPEFLNAVANATSIDAAMGVYFTAAERAALQATSNQSNEVEGSPARMQTAMALSQTLLPQGSGQALEELAIPGSMVQTDYVFGPLIAMPIHLALHINSSLTKLDISHNGMGDAGARILGASLRHNRTLTSLKMDGNGVELDGLKALRGCLYGNKKLVELPFLDADMATILGNLGTQYLDSLAQEIQARVDIGRAYKVYGGGRVHHGMQQAAMAQLKGAKQVQSRCQQTKNKLRTTAAQVQGDILRNQIVAEIKTAKLLAKAEDKAALKSLKDSSKAAEKLDKLEARNKKKAWEDRYRAMKQWKRAVEGAQSARAKTSWWTRWLDEWGRAYLTAEGLDSLWAAVPDGERERFESTYHYSLQMFDQQKELSDQIRELRLLKQTGEADGTFHTKEAEYYNFVASKDPAGVASMPPHPGIVEGRKPGDVRQNFTSYGRTDWGARRQAIISDINSTIRSGPPKDFKWTPMPDPNAPPNANASPAAATAAGAPMLVFGTPVQQVTGTPAGGGAAAAQAISANSGQPRPAPASVAVPAGPAAPDPHYIPTPNASGPTAAPSAPTMAPPPGYPGAAVGATAPYVPPPAPEPYQAAAAAPGGAQGYHFYNSYLEDEQRFQNRPPEYQNYYYGPGRYGGAYDQNNDDDDYYYDRNGRRRRRYSNDGFGMGGSVLPFLLLSSALYSPFFSPWYGGFWGFGFGGYWGYGGFGGGYYNHTEVNNYYINEDNGAQTQDELGDTPPEDVAEANEGADDAGDGGDGGDGGAGGGDGGGDGGDGGEADGMDMYGGAGPTDLPDGSNEGERTAPVESGDDRSKRARHVACWDEAAWEEEAVRLWFERRWADILKAADTQLLGAVRVLPFERQAMALPSRKAATSARCTLVTQASLDRAQQIKAQAAAWGGRISLALYIEAPRGSAASADILADVAALHAALEAGPAAVDISLLWALPSDGATVPYDTMYPVNALRNLALSAATTELVFLLDIDFQPSQGLLEAVEGRAPEWNVTSRAVQALVDASAQGRREMLVVPAFEVAPEDEAGPQAAATRVQCMPRQKRRLAALVKAGKAYGFHVGHFPQGHSPTDFSRWLASRAPYAVQFNEYYEPYVIAARRLVPPYDERFRGYGMNKISHLYASAAAGFRFTVAPEAFVAAFEHKKSRSWQATFGSDARAEQKVRISALYRRFKQELRCVPGALDPLEGPRATPSKPGDETAGKGRAAASSVPPPTLSGGKRGAPMEAPAYGPCKRQQLDPAAREGCAC
eukprot:jgi/Tetstr1/428007/TSEL_018080.t1